MASIVIVSVFISIVLYQIYKFVFQSRPKNFPPGPPRLPIFGAYLFLLFINYNHFHRATEYLCKIYKSTILGFYYGPLIGMSVHDLKTCKEVLNNPDLDGRPIFEIVKARDPDFNVLGIFFKDGPFWKDQRRFALRYMRDFGFGRRFVELEKHINDELLSLVDVIKNGPKFKYEERFLMDGMVLCPKVFTANPGNLLLQVLINDRFGRKDLEGLYKAGDSALAFQRIGSIFGRLFSYMPSLIKLAPGPSGFTAVRKHAMELHYNIREIIVEQYNTYSEKHERHFVDMYIKEIRANRETFSIDQLVHMIIDFMFPTISAIGVTLTYTLQRLILDPEIMKKCQEEIDDIVGRGRLPTLDDRINLAYTEATLRESMRLDTLANNGVGHVALRDTKVGGYDLPKGGLVMTVLQIAHEDETLYKNAKTFNPSRFINRNGKLDLKLDTSIPFGAGKRLCAGETFARNIMFLFLAAILQNFTVKIPEGQKMSHPAMENQPSGIVKTPADCWLKFETR